MSEAALIDARLQPMTLQEWADMPEDEPGELVDGYLVEEEAPSSSHEIVISWLIQVIRNWGAARGAIVLGSGAKYAVAPRRGRMPDLSVFLPGAPKPGKVNLNRRPPTIAVEIVSPTPRDARRDRIAKLAEYAAFGVRWYWLVDPELRSLQIHELVELAATARAVAGEGPRMSYAHAADVTEGVIDVPGCDGLRLDVSALWAEIDSLGDAEPE